MSAGRSPEPPGGARGGAVLAAVFLDGEHEDAAYYRAWAHAADLLVAADGGARFLVEQGIMPDLVVGDLDSIGAALEVLAAAGVAVVRHPVRKDRTDGELAVAEALRRGAGEIVLAGALGALDHTLGHLAILRDLAERGVVGRLVAPHLTVRVLTAPGHVSLDAGPGTRVSLVPLGGDAVVTLRGLDYPLSRGTLPDDACLGLGNAVAATATVEVHAGHAAILVARGIETFAGECRGAGSIA